METLESSRVCRLCGKQSGISINIFDKNENHVKKINAVLPIMAGPVLAILAPQARLSWCPFRGLKFLRKEDKVHEMDLLPKHMCHRCSYKLEEFHKFYVDCLKTDAGLKSQLSWMRKENPRERVGIPMVHIENIKLEPPDYGAYDMSPMVGNANYINSMSSVTFQPNNISYAAYAQCRCCCDKMDQSNQTVASNYKNATVSRCSRLNNIEGCSNGSQPVKPNHLISTTFQERSNLAMFVNEKSNNATRHRLTSSVDIDNAKSNFTAKKEVSRDAIVHNLRPRRGSVDYVGTKKKMAPFFASNSVKSKTPTLQSEFETVQIKVEKPNDFVGHVLRPRIKTVNYCNRSSQRKYTKSKQEESLQGNGNQSSRHKVQNIVNKLKLPSKRVSNVVEDRVMFAIKQEQLSDTEDTLSVTLPKNHATRTSDLSDNVNALPDNLVFNVQNDRNCLLSCTQQNVEISGANKVTVRNTLKSKLKSGKFSLDRFAAISYSPKLLRSQDFFLRNGKVKKFQNTEVSTKKLRRGLRSITDTAKTTRRNLMEAIGNIVSTKKISASIKLIDNNVKHYCESCNISFVNKELFKLHTCYH
ncbi:uncharacterized protein LOC128886399 isoform X1 [Hylaeus anthracinus]|uniref:uncharacterized protein LOC128886399 isoform X1 n=2 Tax=Hylaeus anthracinus TaxID=313031 RepID=UPI0023B8D4F5|nr:uncharacterized protein LOC128886399 isoform X1 [Hylaeus anthracinus]